jgi:hypothetical protein
VAFVIVSVAWAAMLPLAPFLASRAHASALGTLLVVAVYAIGSMICHQLPERSYHLWTAQVPVCARCAGIYAGAAVAGALTLAYEWTTGQTPGNLIRAVSGIPLGAVVAWLALGAIGDGAAAENQVN